LFDDKGRLPGLALTSAFTEFNVGFRPKQAFSAASLSDSSQSEVDPHRATLAKVGFRAEQRTYGAGHSRTVATVRFYALCKCARS
jgi:hypothetical protein